MGVCSFFRMETPERVEHYLKHHEWPQWNEPFRLRYCDLDKKWEEMHYFFCHSTYEEELPQGFICCGKPMPNYDIPEEEWDDYDKYTLEFMAPRLYTVEETKQIAEYLDSLNDKEVLRQLYDPKFMAKNVFGIGTLESEEDQDDYFYSIYYAFERLQRLFHIAASKKLCMVRFME